MQNRIPMLMAGCVAIAACSPSSSGGASALMSRAPAAAPARYEASVERDLARVRAATEAFRSIDAAAAAGYAREVRRCIAHPQHGAMGFHHANRALYDDRLEVERPEILVYERRADGAYVLNGVEYVVPYAARPRESGPPEIMGQKLHPADELGIWYLHVWVWSENGSGMFADWNPSVECRP